MPYVALYRTRACARARTHAHTHIVTLLLNRVYLNALSLLEGLRPIAQPDVWSLLKQARERKTTGKRTAEVICEASHITLLNW